MSRKSRLFAASAFSFLAFAAASAAPSTARAAGWVGVYPADALPALPPASPAPAPAPAAAPAAPAPAPVDADKLPSAPLGRGFVIELGGGGQLVTGSMAQGLDFGAFTVDVSFRLGYFWNRHWGVIAGVQGGTGAVTKGCAGDCQAVSVKVPVVAEYAFNDRGAGAYIDGGLSFVNLYLGASPQGTDSAKTETLETSSPIDMRAALGYRFRKPSQSNGLDVRFSLDMGKFSHIEYGNALASVAGDVAESKPAYHYAASLDVSYAWAP